MQKYFISADDFTNEVLPEDVSYQVTTVLRGKVGDEFLVGVEGKTYLAKITKIDKRNTTFQVIKEETGHHELPVFIHLFQGFPKGDKFEQILKYGTQLGLAEITPVLMDRTIVHLDMKKQDNKLLRYNKILKEAAEQSFRDFVPNVYEPKRLKELDFSNFDLKILCYEESAKEGESSAFKMAIKSLKPSAKVAVVVGPEGGFSKDEVSYLETQGFISVGLGPRILRTETVVFYVLATISYEWELKE